jgi:hypothetical protein
MFVSPNTKLGHVLTFAPEYSAAIKTLKALKLSGYVNKVPPTMMYLCNSEKFQIAEIFQRVLDVKDLKKLNLKLCATGTERK